ncbi:MAG: hypothetical protein IRY94_05575 [Rhodospirillaceae bacterium]|nr:hypothetical protein [Rhodospirillaceae bacterium]
MATDLPQRTVADACKSSASRSRALLDGKPKPKFQPGPTEDLLLGAASAYRKIPRVIVDFYLNFIEVRVPVPLPAGKRDSTRAGARWQQDRIGTNPLSIGEYATAPRRGTVALRPRDAAKRHAESARTPVRARADDVLEAAMRR